MALSTLIWTGLLIGPVIILVVVLRWRQVLSLETSIQIGLAGTPNHATGWEIALLAIRAGLKHILALVYCAAPIKADEKHAQRFKLPHISMLGTLSFNKNDEELFSHAVDAGAGTEKISQLFLVSLTLPLVIHILADRACPILPLGAVNTRNTFKSHQPSLARDIKFLRHASNESRLSYIAYFGGHDRPGYRRKRGMEFSISIIVQCDGKRVLTQDLWFLQFLPKSFEPKYVPSEDEMQRRPFEGDDGPSTVSSTLQFSQKDPTKWAAATKDYNPIHVSALGAKLFGFKSVIAHGNHVVARAMEQLRSEEREGQDTSRSTATSLYWESVHPIIFEVRFVRPVSLPANAKVSWKATERSNSGVELAISSRGKLCISGSLKRGEPDV